MVNERGKDDELHFRYSVQFPSVSTIVFRKAIVFNDVNNYV